MTFEDAMRGRALSAHLERLGGMIVRPRATITRLLHSNEGNVLEVLPWMAIVACAVSPVEAGRAVLLARGDLGEGVVAFLQLLASRMARALAGLLAGAIVLHAIERARKSRDQWIGFDRAMDICGFLLVPYLVLTSVGLLLAIGGLDLWWMPHRRMYGDAVAMVARVGAGFGWSLVLFGMVARILWLGGGKQPQAGAPGPGGGLPRAPDSTGA